MIMDYLLIILIAAICGFGASLYISSSLNYKLKISLVVASTILYSLIWGIIYFENGLSLKLLLYMIFSGCMVLVTITDALETWVDANIILIGAVLVFLVQWSLGNVSFALIGALVSAGVTGVVYILGNRYITNPVPDLVEVGEDINMGGFGLPMIPAFSLAVITHSLLKNGISLELFGLLKNIEANILVSIGLLMLIVLTIRRRMAHTPLNIDSDRKGQVIESDAYTEEGTSFGDGDIMVAILMGLVFGWQNVLGIIGMGFVFHGCICSLVLIYKNLSISLAKE